MALRKAGSKETRKKIADKAAGAAQNAKAAKPKAAAKAEAQAAKREERKSQGEEVRSVKFLGNKMDALRRQRDKAESNGKSKKLANIKEKLQVTRQRLNEARDLRGRKPGAAGGGGKAGGGQPPTAQDGNGAPVDLGGYQGQGSDYIGGSAYRKRSDGSRGGNIYARQN